MNWEKIEYPWKGINIPNSEIDLRMKLFDDFVTYFGFDRMARAKSVGSYERLLYGKRSYNNVANSCYYLHGWKSRRTCQSMTTAYCLRKSGQVR